VLTVVPFTRAQFPFKATNKREGLTPNRLFSCVPVACIYWSEIREKVRQMPPEISGPISRLFPHPGAPPRQDDKRRNYVHNWVCRGIKRSLLGIAPNQGLVAEALRLRNTPSVPNLGLVCQVHLTRNVFTGQQPLIYLTKGG
jgi:hypothetical protein